MSDGKDANQKISKAPIAYIEDTSNEEANDIELSTVNICFSKEKESQLKTKCLIPLMPRIDISRASSQSSNHDSRDSSPDNVFEQVGTGTLHDSGVLGFKEEGTLDLRSSTEELQFMEQENFNLEKGKLESCSPVMFKIEGSQTPSINHYRKDSTNSEVATYLNISGRTSRVSSVGSQGSENSKLSVTSNISYVSRSPSPHRMLLETSFCGPKPLQSVADGGIPSSIEPSTVNVLEKVILSRKKDPSEAVLAEGVGIYKTIEMNSTTIKNRTQAIELSRRKSDSNANINYKDDILHYPPTSRSISNQRHNSSRDINKPIVGIMPSGTEYIRIKLKPDHHYSDNGIADNERILIENKKKSGIIDSDTHSPNSKVDIIDSTQKTHFTIPQSNDTISSSSTCNTFSRKNSFSSFFKPKESTTYYSPNESKKKSRSISNELGQKFRKERCIGSSNTSPKKCSSMLSILKQNKKVTKSTSPTPLDFNAERNSSNIHDEDQMLKNESFCVANTHSHLKYYDKPLNGKSVHIPLHTPPEEKHCESEFINPEALNILETNACNLISPANSIVLKNNCIVSIHNRPKPMPPLRCYRIENPDGTVTIPLKSPTDEKELNQLWNIHTKERNFSNNHDTAMLVTSNHLKTNLIENHIANALPLHFKPTIHDVQAQELADAQAKDIESKNSKIDKKIPSKEKAQWLFSMKIGSGSQEETFTTELNILRTEIENSQVSSLSEIQKTTDTSFLKKSFLHSASENETPSLKEFNKHSQSASNEPSNSFCHYKHNESEGQYGQPDKVNNIRHEESPQTCNVQSMTNDTNDYKIAARDSREFNSEIKHECEDSESEKDSELYSGQNMQTIEDNESAGLVLQESFDDEFPYIPTTLPEERAVGIRLIPMRERAHIEIKTYPLERPRSTTPFYPTAFEDYFGANNTCGEYDLNSDRHEKLKINLPKRNELDCVPKIRSPKHNTVSFGKTRFNYMDQAEQSSKQALEIDTSTDVQETDQTLKQEEPPPLPPRQDSIPKWINFNSVPDFKISLQGMCSEERQKRSNDDINTTDETINYVQPDECQCECHENYRDSENKISLNSTLKQRQQL